MEIKWHELLRVTGTCHVHNAADLAALRLTPGSLRVRTNFVRACEMVTFSYRGGVTCSLARRRSSTLSWIYTKGVKEGKGGKVSNVGRIDCTHAQPNRWNSLPRGAVVCWRDSAYAACS